MLDANPNIKIDKNHCYVCFRRGNYWYKRNLYCEVHSREMWKENTTEKTQEIVMMATKAKLKEVAKRFGITTQAVSMHVIQAQRYGVVDPRERSIFVKRNRRKAMKKISYLSPNYQKRLLGQLSN